MNDWSRQARLGMRAALLVAMLLALASLAGGFINAQTPDGSKDFQYSAARMMLEGRNAYRLYQENILNVLLTQQPNYLPLLFVALLPIGALPWPMAKLAWGAINIALALYAAWRIRGGLRSARVSPGIAVLAALLFLSSTPVRNTIGNGQHGLMIFVLAVFALSARASWVRGLALGLALTKYSLGHVFGSLLAGRRDYRAVVIAGLALVAGYGVFAAMTGTPFNLDLLQSPQKVVSKGISSAPPLNWVADSLGYGVLFVLAGGSLLLLFAWAWLIGRPPAGCPPVSGDPACPRLVLAAILVSLLTAPHAIYDYGLLGLAFVFGNPFSWLSRIGRIAFVLALALTWNGQKLLTAVIPGSSDAGMVALWLLLAVVLVDHLRAGRRADTTPI